ncbi:hypothetical protein BDW42DRAFT_171891 [Aspergillus taichungensis]|uniref:Uncharacterized protein n=1 Tax=Aspergillus taichungensis TaxID=482145 RepID=A0A2J5HRT9_9EURO|nr:hypothetical protein BDW42DRAFT_171891 [Aspergillus taichungensis]
MSGERILTLISNTGTITHTEFAIILIPIVLGTWTWLYDQDTHPFATGRARTARMSIVAILSAGRTVSIVCGQAIYSAQYDGEEVQ